MILNKTKTFACVSRYTYLFKNKLNKNTEAEIALKIRTN